MSKTRGAEIEHDFKCDICGEPATSFARDVIEKEPVGYVRTYRPGDWHAGCDEHPPVSQHIEWNGPTTFPVI